MAGVGPRLTGFLALSAWICLSLFYLFLVWPHAEPTTSWWTPTIVEADPAHSASTTAKPVPPPLIRTNVTRRYDFTIRRTEQHLDGTVRNALLINGQFPGPVIEADYGDVISVTVHNDIDGPPEGTAMHWHGMLQTDTPWFDGVTGVTQCPIAPGASLTYAFLADQFGPSWYHAHHSAQYGAGVFGSMIIHAPHHVPYDIDAGLLTLTDYYVTYYRDILLEVLRPRPFPAAPPSDHNLINGLGDLRCGDTRGPTPCPDDDTVDNLAKLRLFPGKSHLVRLVNAGAEGMQRFSIDGLVLTVISVDFVPVVPYSTEVVTLAVGQRSEVLIRVPEDMAGPLWMRSVISDICSFTNHHSAYGIVNLDESTSVPRSTGWPLDDTDCAGEPIAFLTPYYAISAATPAPSVDIVTIGNHPNATGQWIWLMNGYTAEADIANPVLPLAMARDKAIFRPQWNLFDEGERVVVRVLLNNPIDFPHPMHLHGHNFKVLAEGFGEWDGTITNALNPARRDTQMVRSLGYLVIEFEAERPGLWPFHCVSVAYVHFVDVERRASIADWLEHITCRHSTSDLIFQQGFRSPF